MKHPPAVSQTAIEAAGAVVTPTSLTLTDPDLPWEVYTELGAFIGEINKACAWWGGDLVVFGEQVYGEKVANVDEYLGLAPQTIANRASVARHIPPDRRRASLAFGTHAEVAYLPAKERDRWLDRAEKGGWTRSILREAMRVEREIAASTNSSEGSSSQPSAPAPATTDNEVEVCPHCGRPM